VLLKTFEVQELPLRRLWYGEAWSVSERVPARDLVELCTSRSQHGAPVGCLDYCRVRWTDGLSRRI
jgi:hypothetical protein